MASDAAPVDLAFVPLMRRIDAMPNNSKIVIPRTGGEALDFKEFGSAEKLKEAAERYGRVTVDLGDDAITIRRGTIIRHPPLNDMVQILRVLEQYKAGTELVVPVPGAYSKELVPQHFKDYGGYGAFRKAMADLDVTAVLRFDLVPPITDARGRTDVCLTLVGTERTAARAKLCMREAETAIRMAEAASLLPAAVPAAAPAPKTLMRRIQLRSGKGVSESLRAARPYNPEWLTGTVAGTAAQRATREPLEDHVDQFRALHSKHGGDDQPASERFADDFEKAVAVRHERKTSVRKAEAAEKAAQKDLSKAQEQVSKAQKVLKEAQDDLSKAQKALHLARDNEQAAMSAYHKAQTKSAKARAAAEEPVFTDTAAADTAPTYYQDITSVADAVATHTSSQGSTLEEAKDYVVRVVKAAAGKVEQVGEDVVQGAEKAGAFVETEAEKGWSAIKREIQALRGKARAWKAKLTPNTSRSENAANTTALLPPVTQYMY